MADSEVAICNQSLLKIGNTGGLLDIAALSDGTSLEAQVCTIEYPAARDELYGMFKWPRATRHKNLSQLGGSTYVAGTTYAAGDFVNYAPAFGNVVNMPETITTFVYVSLQASNTGHQPDTSPTYWAQVSRPAWAFVFLLPSDVVEVQGLYRYGRNPRTDQQIPYEIGDDPNVGATLLYTDTGLPWTLDWTDTDVPAAVELVFTAQQTDPKRFPALFTKALVLSLAKKLALALRKDSGEATRLDPLEKQAIAEARAQALRETRKDPPPVPSHIAARRPSGRWGGR